MNYERIYNAIVAKAKSEDRKKIKSGIYYEAHHIIPRCMGGEGLTKDASHPNIVLLTAKEHYICHRLLCEIYPDNNKLRFAMWMMVNGSNRSINKRYIPSGRIYNQIRESKPLLSKESRKKISDSNKGQIRSDEIRKRMSESKKGISRGPMTIEQKKKLSDSLKDRVISEETKKKMSNSRKGKELSEEHKKALSKPKSIEARKNMSGKIISEETRKKLSNASRNRLRLPHSEETRKKMSDSARNRQNKKKEIIFN